MDTETKQAIGKVLGRVPSGIWILSVRNAAGHETGMLASWVQQASFEPPMVSVAVKSERYINDWLHETEEAALSLLGQSQKDYVTHFGNGFHPHEEAFQNLDVVRSPGGAPVLADCVGHLEGPIRAVVPSGDHRLYLVEIQHAGIGPRLDSEKPMVHIRKSGFHY